MILSAKNRLLFLRVNSISISHHFVVSLNISIHLSIPLPTLNKINLTDTTWSKKDWAVPQEDGSTFAHPSLKECADWAKKNQEMFTSFSNHSETSVWIAQVRQQAREEALQLALKYTSDVLKDPLPHSSAGPLIGSGHQPGLSHPGVWVKHFLIHSLSRIQGARSLNLIIDNDVLSQRSIRVPTWREDRFQTEWIQYDGIAPEAPWEECQIIDPQLFESFLQRVLAKMKDHSWKPLLENCWKYALSTGEKTGNLRDALTSTRHAQEAALGIRNLELPLSLLCETESFLKFVCYLLHHLSQFRSVHNQVLKEYRKINRVRSQTHPVPELKQVDDWLEAPFWIWRAGETKRRRLFVQTLRDHFHLRMEADGEIVASIPHQQQTSGLCGIEQLRELSQQGYRLRTRALTTTLFARLFVMDLFVHGIGGAKYDEMTDQIIQRFFEVPVPRYTTISATVQLPIPLPHPVTTKDLLDVKHLLRELKSNADRVCEWNSDSDWNRLIEEKQSLIREQHQAETARGATRSLRRQQARANRERYLKLRSIQNALYRMADPKRRELEEELASLELKLKETVLVQSREYAWCLFPEDKIRGFFEELWSLLESN